MSKNYEIHPEANPSLEISDDFYNVPGHEHFIRISDTKMSALFGINDEQWARLVHSDDAASTPSEIV